MEHHAVTVGLEQSISVGGHAFLAMAHGIRKAHHELIIHPGSHVDFSVAHAAQAAGQVSQQLYTFDALQAVIVLQQGLQHPLLLFFRELKICVIGSHAGKHILQLAAAHAPIGSQPAAAVDLGPGFLIRHSGGLAGLAQLARALLRLQPQRSLALQPGLHDGGAPAQGRGLLLGVYFLKLLTLGSDDPDDTGRVLHLFAWHHPPVIQQLLLLSLHSAHTKAQGRHKILHPSTVR